jgi:uncharacterized membrane protein
MAIPDQVSAEPIDAAQRPVHKGRLEAFSDGVFAIAITILVLEISLPAGAEDELLRAIADQWPSYLAYVVSFSTIGALWVAHSVITDHLVRADVVFVRFNLLVLLVVAFVPFPTALLAEQLEEEHLARIAATIYGCTLLAARLLIYLLWTYALRANLVGPHGDREILDLTREFTPSFAGYLTMILVGLLFPFVAVLGYLFIAVVLMLPFGIERKGR